MVHEKKIKNLETRNKKTKNKKQKKQKQKTQNRKKHQEESKKQHVINLRKIYTQISRIPLQKAQYKSKMQSYDIGRKKLECI